MIVIIRQHYNHYGARLRCMDCLMGHLINLFEFIENSPFNVPSMYSILKSEPHAANQSLDICTLNINLKSKSFD